MVSTAKITSTDRNPSNVLKINLTFALGVGGVSAILLATLIGAYVRFEQQRDLIKFLGSSITTVGGVAGAVYISKNLHNAVEHQNSTAETNKKIKSQEFMKRWNSPGFYETKEALRKAKAIMDSGGNQEEKYKALTELAEVEGNRGNLLNALSFFEELCISIENGMACEKTAHDFFESVIITYYRVLESWISERRKEVYHPYSMYGNLKTVYEKWEKDKRWS
jgi:hypothetical protein